MWNTAGMLFSSSPRYVGAGRYRADGVRNANALVWRWANTMCLILQSTKVTGQCVVWFSGFWTIQFQLSQDWGRCPVSVWGRIQEKASFLGEYTRAIDHRKTTIRVGQPLSGGPQRLRFDRVSTMYFSGLFCFHFKYYSITEPPVNSKAFAER